MHNEIGRAKLTIFNKNLLQVEIKMINIEKTCEYC